MFERDAKDVNDIKLKVPHAEAVENLGDTGEAVIDTTPQLPTQKVTIIVEESSWRELKVVCARNKIKITEQAGKIIKEWVATNSAAK